MKRIKAAGVLMAVLVVSGMAGIMAGCCAYGLQPYVVISGSMEPEIPVGSVVLTATHTAEIGTQDVITYRIGERTITHRVVEQNAEGYITKGDSNPAEDPVIVSPDQVVGKVISCIPYVGYVILFLRKPFTLFLLLFTAAVSVILWSMKRAVQKKRGVLHDH